MNGGRDHYALRSPATPDWRRAFNILPAIVDAVLGDAEVAELRFVLQANFAFRLPCRRSKSVRLCARPAKHWSSTDARKLNYCANLLDEDAYRRLLLDADLVVLPYDGGTTYARCSGVPVEAPSSWPAIASANCWMAA